MALVLAGALGLAATSARADVAIPFTRTTLPNGMVVILHEDHAVPTVVVNVSYNVGSRFEVAAPHGLRAPLRAPHVHGHAARAHEGLRRVDGGRGRLEQRVDQPGPHRLLRRRPAHRARPPPLARGRPPARPRPADDAREARCAARGRPQRATPDAARTRRTARSSCACPSCCTGKDHPVPPPRHRLARRPRGRDRRRREGASSRSTTIPANASIVVAGDFDPEAREGRSSSAGSARIPSRGPSPIPGAPGFSGHEDDAHDRSCRETIEDDVELPKVVMAWQSPKHFAPRRCRARSPRDRARHGQGEPPLQGARLRAEARADASAPSQESAVLGSRFTVDVIARPGVSLDKLEAAIDKELEKIRKAPLADEELERAKNLVETVVRRAPRGRARARVAPQHVPGRGEGPGLRAEGPRALPPRDEGPDPRRRRGVRRCRTRASSSASSRSRRSPSPATEGHEEGRQEVTPRLLAAARHPLALTLRSAHAEAARSVLRRSSPPPPAPPAPTPAAPPRRSARRAARRCRRPRRSRRRSRSRYTRPNGMTVWLLERHALPIVVDPGRRPRGRRERSGRQGRPRAHDREHARRGRRHARRARHLARRRSPRRDALDRRLRRLRLRVAHDAEEEPRARGRDPRRRRREADVLRRRVEARPRPLDERAARAGERARCRRGRRVAAAGLRRRPVRPSDERHAEVGREGDARGREAILRARRGDRSARRAWSRATSRAPSSTRLLDQVFGAWKPAAPAKLEAAASPSTGSRPTAADHAGASSSSTAPMRRSRCSRSSARASPRATPTRRRSCA